MPSASPTDRITVRTGGLSATVVEGSLRDVQVNGVLALDAIYVAVRDSSWGTIAGTFSDYRVTGSADSFTVEVTCRHEDFFEWRGRIKGDGGTVSFELAGTALRPFSANRIGFCLLHPIDLAGHAVVARTGSGELRGCFPEPIAPYQPFVDLHGLRYHVSDESWLELAFEGEVFEMEDHRNWTDAGWKTYCTPLARPYPVTYATGDRIRQVVTFDVRRLPATPRRLGSQDRGASVLPTIGFGAAADVPSALRPSHLAVELRLSDDWQAALDKAASRASALGAGLEVALDADGRPWGELAAVLARHELQRVAVFDATTHVTPPGAASALRAALREHGCEAPVGGGSHLWFAELNRARLSLAELEFVTYGISPQLHHFDNDSIMDTLLTHADTARGARRIAGGRPIVVGPVRLHPDELDPRQGTAFHAAWTAGSVLALGEGGADSVTYLDSCGAGQQVLAALARRAGQPIQRLVPPSRDVMCYQVGTLTVAVNLRDGHRVVDLPDRSLRLAPYEVEVTGE